jgi:superfamily I DNA and/or RNA helicase
VDTVERMQGSEFDIVIFSATVSDKDTIHSPFLKEYRRFNVSLTRARKKFIFVASAFFFQSFPRTEKELTAQMPFENFASLFCANPVNLKQ